MNKKHILGLAMIGLSLSTTGCNPSVSNRETSSKKNPYLSEVVIDRNIEKPGEQIKILQLTDLHWNTQTDLQLQKTFLRACVEKSNPDLVVLTGDQLLNATKQIARSLNQELHDIAEERHQLAKEGKKSIVPIRDENGDMLNKDNDTTTDYSFAKKETIRPMYFTYTWGNHDMQGSYSCTWLNDLAQSSKYSLYRDPGIWSDDIAGYGNNAIDFKVKGKDDVAWRVYTIDSHPNHNENGKYGYSPIAQNQIKWLEDQAKDLEDRQKDKTKITPSNSFFHVCPWEFVEAFYKDNGAKVELDKNGNEKFNPDGTHVYSDLGRTFNGVVGSDDKIHNRYNFNGKVLGYVGENFWSVKTISKPTKDKDGNITGQEKIPFGTSMHRSVIERKDGQLESFVDVSAKLGVLGMHVGHDHQNDWVTQYEHKNPIDKINRSVVLGYGVKSSRELYFTSKGTLDMFGEDFPTVEARRNRKTFEPKLNGEKYTNGLYNLDFNDDRDHDNLYNTGNGKYIDEGIGSTKTFPKPGEKTDYNRWGFDHSGATLLTLHPYQENTANPDVRGNFDLQHLYVDTLDIQDTIGLSEEKRNEVLWGKWLTQRATNLPNAAYNDITYTPENIGGIK